MLIPHLLEWLQLADEKPRAEAAAVLARAWEQSDMTEDERDMARSALVLLLDDACAAVRKSMADVLAYSMSTPRAVLFGLLQAEDDVAVLVLRHSPLLGDGDLIYSLGDESPLRQEAVASRGRVSAALSAAVAEVGCVEACGCLLDNSGAVILPGTLDRLVVRFAGDAEFRQRLLVRKDLTLLQRYDLLMLQMLETMTGCFGDGDGEIDDLPVGVVEETSDRIVLQVAEEVSEGELDQLIEHLRGKGRLTTRLLLRTVCCGRLRIFARSLALLTGVPLARICKVLQGQYSSATQALFRKAGLPLRTFQTFQLALTVLQQGQAGFDRDLNLREARQLTEVLLGELQDEALSENGDILNFLRNFALDVSRLEARAMMKKVRQGQIGQDRGMPRQASAA